MSTPRTAFVLTGGASLGAAAQVGMLRPLWEHGITADLLVGTSPGALNAAFVASRPRTGQTARELGRMAITASASIPGVLPPVVMGERYLVDEGVVNNTPISPERADAEGDGRDAGSSSDVALRT